MRLITLALAVVALGTSIPRSASARADVVHQTLKGSEAIASFVQTTSTPCNDGSGNSATVTTTVSVMANDSVIRGEGAQAVDSADVIVIIDSFSCAGAPSSRWGIASIPHPDYHHASVQSADLKGSFVISDFDTGESLGTVNVAGHWEGIGDIYRDQYVRHLHTGNITLTNHSNGASRLANVSGTFTFNGVDLLPYFQGAFLLDNKYGAVVVSKP